ncbi:TIGR03032 family protein [Thalassospiraceae bacterium LMO-JJ14]|nr:TIGR03032 family protein [Thalassospiraceae bacterium LMO-JJ14]
MPPRKKTAAKSKSPSKKTSSVKSKPGDKTGTDDSAKSVELITSRHFASWMAGQGISLAFTTYQASKLFLIGLTPEGEISVSERTIDRCMGIASSGRSLYVASKWQIWRFENAMNPGERADGYDAVYVPKASHVTGDVDCHEMAVDGDGRLVFVNTLFNSLSYLSRDYSFFPAWKPDFISAYVPEDRCHLNGVAIQDGRPAYVTAVSRSDMADGWRDRRKDGGIVIDVRSNEIVCEGLSMPHSPRLHGKTLWVQDSGTGFLGRVDVNAKNFEPVVMCPGFLRGMTIVGNFAIACISKGREGHTFGDLALEQNLKDRDTDARCGLVVIELTSGNILHWLRLEGLVEELFGVAALQGVLNPRAVGFKSDEIARTISLPPDLN